MRDRTREHHHDHRGGRHAPEAGGHPHHGGGHRRGPHGRGHHETGHFGGPRGRARRGEARYILLDALRDGPKHGYEIIKALEERSSGQYAASPGTVYPTLQYLEELGLARADQEAERRVYHLTEAGVTELGTHAQDIEAFWARFAGPTATDAGQPEVGFLSDALDALAKTIWGGLREAVRQGDQKTIRRVRQAVEQCQNEIREVIVGHAATEPMAGETTARPAGENL